MWETLLKTILKCSDPRKLEAIRKGVIDAYHGQHSEIITEYVSNRRMVEVLDVIDARLAYIQSPKQIVDALLDYLL